MLQYSSIACKKLMICGVFLVFLNIYNNWLYGTVFFNSKGSKVGNYSELQILQNGWHSTMVICSTVLWEMIILKNHSLVGNCCLSNVYPKENVKYRWHVSRHSLIVSIIFLILPNWLIKEQK